MPPHSVHNLPILSTKYGGGENTLRLRLIYILNQFFKNRPPYPQPREGEVASRFAEATRSHLKHRFLFLFYFSRQCYGIYIFVTFLQDVSGEFAESPCPIFPQAENRQPCIRSKIRGFGDPLQALAASLSLFCCRSRPRKRLSCKNKGTPASFPTCWIPVGADRGETSESASSSFSPPRMDEMRSACASAAEWERLNGGRAEPAGDEGEE